MEVHHHSHTSRKKWTHYFWEFLMLFLAVFCGFLAENFREHTVESKRERAYIKLMIEDFQNDTTTLRRQIKLMNQYVKGLDTLITETYAYKNHKGDTRKMYYCYHHYCRNRITPTLTKITITQLKNSGNLRLIHDKQAVDIISNAEIFFEWLDENIRFWDARQEDVTNFGLKIFDFGEYKKANIEPDGSTNQTDDGFLKLNYQPPLNFTDLVYLNEFSARVGYYRNSLDVYITLLKRRIPFFENSINTLKKAYNF